MPYGLAEKGVKHSKYSFKGFTSTQTSNLKDYKIPNRTKKIGNWKLVQDKYQCAPLLDGKAPFVENDDEVETISALRNLLNYLRHYKPKWITYDISNRQNLLLRRKSELTSNNILKERTFEYKLANELKEQLEKYVKDHDHISNPLLPDSNSFPYVYLWSACVDWAINLTMDFTNTFSSKMGLNWSNQKPHVMRKYINCLSFVNRKTIVFSCISFQTFDNKSSVG